MITENINLKNLKICKATKDKEFSIIKNLAYDIWPEVYKHVLNSEHILFLLNKYFEEDKIKEHFKNGYDYYLIENKNVIMGFLSFKVFDEYIYIDKFYLLKEFRGKGVLKFFVENAYNSYKKPLKLNVNQKNIDAISAYLKIGFVVEKEEIIRLNDKMTNVDFVMKFEK